MIEKSHLDRGRNSRTRGFTLAELLLVTAIVGLLAALLLSALAVAKKKARLIQCINCQKQWALAVRLYVDDHDGWIPREGIHSNGSVYWNNWAQVKDSASADVWYNALAKQYLGKKPASSYAHPTNRLSFYKSKSFFHCAGARFPKSDLDIIAMFSIAMNSQLIEPLNSTIKFERICKPSQTPIFLDNLLEEEKPMPQQAGDNLGQPAAFANRFAGRRHGRSGVIAFADGNVRAMRGKDVVSTNGWAIFPERDVVWYPE